MKKTPDCRTFIKIPFDAVRHMVFEFLFSFGVTGDVLVTVRAKYVTLST